MDADSGSQRHSESPWRWTPLTVEDGDPGSQERRVFGFHSHRCGLRRLRRSLARGCLWTPLKTRLKTPLVSRGIRLNAAATVAAASQNRRFIAATVVFRGDYVRFIAATVVFRGGYVRFIAAIVVFRGSYVRFIAATVVGRFRRFRRAAATVAGASRNLREVAATVAGASRNLREAAATVAGAGRNLREVAATVAGAGPQSAGASHLGHDRPVRGARDISSDAVPSQVSQVFEDASTRIAAEGGVRLMRQPQDRL